MAKQTASQLTAWVKTEATVEAVDTGDILAPLRRVQKQYQDRAEKFELRGDADLAERNERRLNGHTVRPITKKKITVEYLQEQAANVARLLEG